MSSTTVKGTVKDFFVYLGLALVLYSTLGLITSLSFVYIDIFLSLSNFYQGYAKEAVRWQISALVIIFPVLLGLSYVINKDIRRDVSKLEIRSRKWLLYSVMFLTSVTGVVDLVVLVNGFLGGDLAKEFLLKLLAVLLIAGVTFTYYYQELKRSAVITVGTKVLNELTLAVVVGMILFGFYTVGSPIAQRRQKLDEERSYATRYIASSVSGYFQAKGSLPKNLEELNNYDSYTSYKDPETGEYYEYKVLSKNSFEVCANFTTNRKDHLPDYLLSREKDYHPGRNCFPNTVEKPAAE